VNLYAKLDQVNLEGLLVSSDNNISYLTKYPSRDSYLLATKKKNLYFTDSRYLQAAQKQLRGIAGIEKIKDSVYQSIAHACRRLGLERIGFEEGIISWADFNRLRVRLGRDVKLIPSRGLIEDLRLTKDSAELDKIRTATKITIKALEFIKKHLKPGIKELEVAAELERFIRYEGGHGSAFNIIVASGPNSSFPHHITSHAKIKDNQPLLIDIGTDYFGYKSDLTRVFFLGKINPLARRVYDIVRKASTQAIKKIKPGISIKEVDATSRRIIAKSGYAKYFGHALGHGIGLDTHEAPSISSRQAGVFKPGMVFTIEPAVYLPGRFGIRIEDMVLVTRKGCEVISGTLNK
jgi:Xaa-Pro aminopeptidase